MGFIGLFSLVNFPDALLLLRAKDLGYGFAGDLHLRALQRRLSYAALSYPAGHLSDRLGRRRVFAAGMGVFAVAYLGFGLTTDRGVAVADHARVRRLHRPHRRGQPGVGRPTSCPPPTAAPPSACTPRSPVLACLVAGVWAGLAWNGTGHGPFIVLRGRGGRARRRPRPRRTGRRTPGAGRPGAGRPGRPSPVPADPADV